MAYISQQRYYSNGGEVATAAVNNITSNNYVFDSSMVGSTIRRVDNGATTTISAFVSSTEITLTAQIFTVPAPGTKEDFVIIPLDKNFGSYQYVSLKNIVNNFMLMYQGNNELVRNINRYQVLFYAKRAIQELNYDAFKELKVLQIIIDDALRVPLPSDFVNWVRVGIYRNGILFPLTQDIQTNTSLAYNYVSTTDINYKNDDVLIYDQDGNVTSPEESSFVQDRIDGAKKSIYLNQGSPFFGMEGFEIDGRYYFYQQIGARFGLNTETANANPTFVVDKKSGVINFSSGVGGEIVLIEYVSDGMENGDDDSVEVNKLFEDYIYAEIKYRILNNKMGVQEYIVRRAKKDRMALLRNAKIRMSNIHPGRLLMNMRGKDKWLK